MQYSTIVIVTYLMTLSHCIAVQKRAESSEEGSVSTVYSFLGASGSDTSVLQMPTSAVSLASETSSSSIDESSALSQFLNGAHVSSAGTQTTSQSAVTSSSSAISALYAAQSTSGSQSASSSSAREVSSSSASASSSTASASLSAGANTLGLPLVAGGILAGFFALI